MSGKPWTQAESDTVLRRYPHEPTEGISRDMGRTASAIYQHARRHGVYKSAAHKLAMQRKGSDALHAAGRAHRFHTGQWPWNKGTHIDNGSWHRFEKGHRPHTWRPVGSERINKDGQRERKTAEPRTWKTLHVIEWERHNGPVPAGHIVVFANRDPGDLRIENLICIDRAENMRRNTIHRYPRDLMRTAIQLGWFNRKLKQEQSK